MKHSETLVFLFDDQLIPVADNRPVVDDHVDVGQVVQIFQQVTRYDQYLGDLARFECSPFVFNA